jgi:hypothetical protein
VQKRRQWPSSARPTQLNTNIEDAIATTDAKVTIVLTVSITEPRCSQRLNSVERLLFYQGGNLSQLILNLTVAGVLQRGCAARKKPAFAPPSGRVGGESKA